MATSSSSSQAQQQPSSHEALGMLASAASIAAPFQTQVSDAIQRRQKNGKSVPKLVGILATPDAPSVAYAQWTKKACEQVGIHFEVWQTWSEGSSQQPNGNNDVAMEKVDRKPDTDLEADVEDLIIAANGDDTIHGIMVYYPIFGGRQDTYLQQIVDPRKDVEGLHFSYCFNMYHNIRWIAPAQLGGAPGTTFETDAGTADSKNDNQPAPGYAKSILPCTPLAVVKCLETLEVYDGSLPYGDRLYGKVITVINRSEVVGRPLAALLSNDGAKVYSIDVETVQEFNKRAEHEHDRKPSKIVMLARQRNASHRLRPSHIVRPCDMAMEDCIRSSDVVISGVPSASFKVQTSWIKSGAVTVNFSSEKNFDKDVRTKASKHLPAIGKMTIAMLQRNLIRLVEYRELLSSSLLHGTRNASGQGGDERDGTNKDGSMQMDQSADSGIDGKPSGRSSSNATASDPPASAPGHSKTHAMDQDGFALPASSAGQAGGAMTSIKEQEEDSGRKVEPKADDRRPMSAGQGPSSSNWPRATLPFHRNNGHVNRERASTLYSTRPAERPPVLYMTPPVPVRRITNTSGPAGQWEWRSPSSVRSDSISSTLSTQYPVQTPPFNAMRAGRQNESQSPLLFAPIGNGLHMQAVPSGSLLQRHEQARSLQQAGVAPPSVSSPRSATPVSPLVIDGLSVEDNNSQSQRMSWDSGPPRTPHDVCDVPLPSSTSSGNVPSVLGRPERDVTAEGAISIAHKPLSPSEDKMTLDQFDSRSANAPPMTGAFVAPQYPQTTQLGGLTSQHPPAHQMSRAPFTQDRLAHSRRRRRPPFSYSSLIAQAIASSPEGRMTLREIYTWISNAYPDLYSMDGNEGSGWQNTVRHNLSLNKAFIKVARTAQDIYDSCSSGLPSLSQQARGKGGWWMLDPNVNPATIASGGKGELLDEDFDLVRTQRRRRTNSMAASIASEDSSDLNSPYSTVPVQLHGHGDAPPSVLQQRGRAFTSSAVHGSTPPVVPSVLRTPQPTSMDRSFSSNEGKPSVMQQPSPVQMPAPQRQLQRGDSLNRSRPRGYTTSAAADLANRGGMPIYTQSPRFNAHPYSAAADRRMQMSPASQARVMHAAHPSVMSPGFATTRAAHERGYFSAQNTPANASIALPLAGSPNKRKLRFDGGDASNGAATQSNVVTLERRSPRPMLDSLALVASTAPRTISATKMSSTDSNGSRLASQAQNAEGRSARMSITGLLS